MLIGHGRLLLDGTVDSPSAAAEQKRVMRARIGQGRGRCRRARNCVRPHGG